MSREPDLFACSWKGTRTACERNAFARKNSNHDIMKGAGEDRAELPGSGQAWHLPCFCPKCSAVDRFISYLLEFERRTENFKMIIRTVEDLKDLGSFRENPGIWSSARYLLSRDSMGFTLTETRISAGSSQTMQYKNHVEANLVIEGRGLLTEIETGAVHKLEPGTMYALDQHDRHRVDARTEMRIVCVFLPALVGPETHDEVGSYPAPEQ